MSCLDPALQQSRELLERLKRMDAFDTQNFDCAVGTRCSFVSLSRNARAAVDAQRCKCAASCTHLHMRKPRKRGDVSPGTQSHAQDHCMVEVTTDAPLSASHSVVHAGSQDNDVERETQMNREYVDYTTEESWRWAIACENSLHPMLSRSWMHVSGLHLADRLVCVHLHANLPAGLLIWFPVYTV